MPMPQWARVRGADLMQQSAEGGDNSLPPQPLCCSAYTCGFGPVSGSHVSRGTLTFNLMAPEVTTMMGGMNLQRLLIFFGRECEEISCV